MPTYLNLRLSDESLSAIVRYITRYMQEEGRTMTKTEAINRMLIGYGGGEE